MQNVIDSLVLELGLDPSKFTKGQQDALNQLRRFREDSAKVGGEIERQGTNIIGLFTRFRSEVLGAVGLYFGVGMIKSVFDGINRMDLAVSNLGQTVGVSSREMTVWQAAMKSSGGSAEGASSAIAGLSSEMMRFKLTGQTGMLGVLGRLNVSLADQNGNLKTSTQLWIDLADAVQGMDPREAAGFLQMIPGANRDMINFALLGGKAMRQFLADASKVVGPIEQSAELARNYVQAMSELETSATTLGRTLTVAFGPTVTNEIKNVLKMIQSVNWAIQHPTVGLRNMTKGLFGWLFNEKDLDTIYGKDSRDTKDVDDARALLAEQMRLRFYTKEDKGRGGAVARGYSGGTSIADVEKIIREEATRRGVDPDIALQVARSEGLYNYKSTVPGEESYGPYQLYFGSKGGGGLGPHFLRKTGIDPRTDRSEASIRAQAGFAMDEAIKGGWGPWYGWKGLPRAGLPAPGSYAPAGNSQETTNNYNVTTHVGQITASTAQDAQAIADSMAPFLKRGIFASHAETGNK